MNSTSAVPLPTELTPLSPAQFAGSRENGGTATTTDMPFTDSDRATLQAAQELLRAARAHIASRNSKLKAAAQKQLETVISYLTGFCDGRGWLDAAPVKPGFEAVFGEQAKRDLDTMLDEIDTLLEQLVTATETRGWLATTVRALGDVLAAASGAALFAPEP